VQGCVRHGHVRCRAGASAAGATGIVYKLNNYVAVGEWQCSRGDWDSEIEM
jgi:hypothetical protein